MADVIVVGAGICGLQLAALLASDGRRVTVLEKLSHVGGRAFLWEKDGFVVDNGIHLIRFGPESSMARVFKHLGKPLGFVELQKSYAALPFGRVVDFPTSPLGFLTTKMMAVKERLKTFGLMLKLKLSGTDDLLDTSVESWMDAHGIKGGMRTYLHLVSASMQVCPFIDRSSAGEMLLNIEGVLKKGHSAMYPTRGWSHIYDVLQQTIKANGEVRTGAKVERVTFEDRRATGVVLDSGERLEADLVVVNLPSQQLFEVIDETRVPDSFVDLCKNLRPTAGVSIDYGLKRKVTDDAGLWYLWHPMSFGLFTSNLCPHVAPPGKQLVTWFAPANPEDLADKKKAEQLEQSMEHAIFRLFTGFQEAVEWRRPMHLKMVDGVEVNVVQHRNKRPGFMVPGIDGLFLVGDSLAAPGAGGDIGHESVLCTYKEITGREV